MEKFPSAGETRCRSRNKGGAAGVESPDGKFVYYLLKSGEQVDSTELWRVPAEGGEEVRIVESVCPQYFAVTERGIYFFSGWGKPLVQRFNFATRKVETVAKVDRNVVWGLTVSPDSRWLLYSASENTTWQSELMMVEKFR